MERYERDRLSEQPDFKAVLQGIGATIGIVCIILGVILCLMLFFGILGAIREPETYRVTLDKWEMIISGSVSGVDTVYEEIKLPADIKINPNTVYRIIAVFVALFLLLILVRLGYLLIRAGNGLLALGNPYKEIYQKILKELVDHKKRSKSS